MNTHTASNSRSNRNENPTGWQHYLAERDQLFLRSRSISVSEMATTLAHELNQPLGAISNILNGLQLRIEAGTADADQYSNAVDLALQQTQFAARIIARIRDFTESRQPEFVQFNVVDLLNHSVRLLDWVFSADSIRVVLTCTEPDDLSSTADEEHNPEQFLVTADYTMIQQVFTNLLRNACDSIRDTQHGKRVIRMMVSRVHDGIKIEIKDTGSGLKGVDPENLFTPFQTSKKDGMGVGLNICKSLIELHQGKLWVTPNQGAGCTAHVLLRTLVPGDCDA